MALLTDEDLFTPSLPALQIGPVQITPPLQFGFWTTVVRNASLTSLSKHLFVVRYHLQGEPDPAGDLFAGKIEAADMVPGDWAYLKNVPAYEIEVPYGAFAGENAFYIRERTRGDPTSRVFFGFGLEPRPGEPGRFFTEQDLAAHMAADFNRNAPRRPRALPEQMVWTRLGSPMLDGADPREAGPFVRDAGRWRGGPPWLSRAAAARKKVEAPLRAPRMKLPLADCASWRSSNTVPAPTARPISPTWVPR